MPVPVPHVLGQRVPVGHNTPHPGPEEHEGEQRRRLPDAVADQGSEPGPSTRLGGAEQHPCADYRCHQGRRCHLGASRAPGHDEVLRAGPPAPGVGHPDSPKGRSRNERNNNRNCAVDHRYTSMVRVRWTAAKRKRPPILVWAAIRHLRIRIPPLALPRSGIGVVPRTGTSQPGFPSSPALLYVDCSVVYLPSVIVSTATLVIPARGGIRPKSCESCPSKF